MIKQPLIYLIFSIASIGFGRGVFAMDFSFVDFAVPGAADTVLNSLNDHGKVVGFYTDDFTPGQPLTPGMNGFVADADGQNLVTLMPHVDAIAVEAAAVNNSGVVAGSFSLSISGFETARGFVFDGASYHVLDAPFQDTIDTVVANIDDAGVVVGGAFEAAFDGGGAVQSGFRATPDGKGNYTYERIDLGSSSLTRLRGRNAQFDEIAVETQPGLPPASVLVNDPDGQATSANVVRLAEISYPMSGSTNVSDINDNGTIVGTAFVAVELPSGEFEFADRAFSVETNDLKSMAAENVPYADLPIPGSGNTFGVDLIGGTIEPEGHSGVQSINSQGAIVGFYDDDDGVYRGFIGTPSAGGDGDFDVDGDVDGDDFLKWQRDGLGSAELSLWEQNYGAGIPAEASAGPIPEPATLALLGLGWACVIGRSTRSRSNDAPNKYN